MVDWQLESLRLTAFRNTPIGQVVPLWENLTGEKPAKLDSQPRINVIQEEGQYLGGMLIHNSNPIQINWLLLADQKKIQSAFPLLGPYTEMRDKFIELMSKWLISENVPDLKRIALGTIMLMPVDNLESGYNKLANFLPNVKIDVKNSSDFMYQINRPIKSRLNIPNLDINRLSKWSVSLIVGLGLFFGAKPEVISDKSKEYFACRLELDINTSQNRNEIFSKEDSVKILNELLEFTTEIAEKGDINTMIAKADTSYPDIKSLYRDSIAVWDNWDDIDLSPEDKNIPCISPFNFAYRDKNTLESGSLTFENIHYQRNLFFHPAQARTNVGSAIFLNVPSNYPSADKPIFSSTETSDRDALLCFSIRGYYYLDADTGHINIKSISADDYVISSQIELKVRNFIEYFKEDDFDSNFNTYALKLTNIFRDYGKLVLSSIRELINNQTINTSSIYMLLKLIGLAQDDNTHDDRIDFLAHYLKNKNAIIRDGSVFGLSLLDDKKSIPFLESALRDESLATLKRNIKTAIDELNVSY